MPSILSFVPISTSSQPIQLTSFDLHILPTCLSKALTNGAYFGLKPIFSGSKTTGHLLNYLVTICSLENKQLNNFPENPFFLFKWIIKVEWRDNLTIFRNFFSGHHVQCILFSLLCSKFFPDGFHQEIDTLSNQVK